MKLIVNNLESKSKSKENEMKIEDLQDKMGRSGGRKAFDGKTRCRVLRKE